MRCYISIIIVFASVCFCQGQRFNLVPLDSVKFEVIADSLINKYDGFPDSINFNPDTYKSCQCSIDSVEGLISYKSSANFIKSNRCLFIYRSTSDYFIRVGQMTRVKDKFGLYKWVFSIKKLTKEVAEQYISKAKNEINIAEVSRFRELVIVNDSVSHTFGDIEKGQYATTPITNYSDSLKKLIKLSVKLIRKNF